MAVLKTLPGLSPVDHGAQLGLGDDDHTQYVLASGIRAFTGTVSGVTPTDPAHLTTKQYVDDQIIAGDSLGDHTATQDLDMSTFAIINVGNVDGVDVSGHASRHERAGADELDGDHLGIDFTPSNYTPDIAPAEAANVDDLAAHLKGIDLAIGIVSEIDTNVDDLITLSGVAENSTDLGVFTGSTITDNVAVKAVLQELETEVELKETIVVVSEIDTNVDDLITLSGVAENATDLGVFDGSTITDNVTVRAAIQALETEVELKETITVVGEIDTNVNDLITLSGVSENSSNLGTFTGATISDSNNIKGALQELETEIELKETIVVVSEIDTNVDDLITLSGVVEQATDLGTFTGSTISDSGTVKSALQELETEVELKETIVVVSEIDTNVNDLITLSGVAENATNLGTFTGSIITDSVAIKVALQELETEVELKETIVVVSEIDTNVNDLIALSGVAENATNLGTFTGATITDSVAIKVALQELETELELKETITVVGEIDTNVNDLITLSGVAENASDLGTFTGAIITDSVTIKTALQELETEVGSLALGSARRQIYDVTAGSVAPASGAIGGTLGFFQALKFDPDTNNDIYFQFAVPDNVDTSAAIVVVLKYSMSTSSANDVKLDLDYIAADLTDDVDPAAATATLTDTFAPGTGIETLKRHVVFEIASGDVASINMMVSCHLTRDAVAGVDTHTGSLDLLGIEIFYTVS